MRWAVAVLAAGLGTRMRSSLPKVLHPLSGRGLIDHVLDGVLEIAAAKDVLVVVGHGSDMVVGHIAPRGVAHAIQERLLGTGDALRVAVDVLAERECDGVVVLSGDVPLLCSETVIRLREQVEQGDEAAVLTAEIDDPGAYGRVVRGNDGSVEAIVEAADADSETLALNEVNAGAYAFRWSSLTEALATLKPDNAQDEYYLTDVIGRLREKRLPVSAVQLDDPTEMHGVNTRADLAEVSRLFNQRMIQGLLNQGVTIIDPETTWVDAGCRLGQDVILEPGVILRGSCQIGARATVGAHSVLVGVTVAPDEEVPPLTLRRGGCT